MNQRNRTPAYRLNHPSTRPIEPLKEPDPSRPAALTIVASGESVELEVHDESRKLVLRLRMKPADLVAALARYARQPAELVYPAT